jgi:MFS transporter, DHA3 family, macrolide efflux protein
MTASAAYTPPPNGFRTFIIVWITQSISVLGSALTFFGLNIWLLNVLYARPEQKADLALALSATALAFGLPTVFLAPIAGAWADRHDRKRTMIVADLLNGVVSLTLMFLVVTQLLQLWSLVVIMVVEACLGAFHGAAFDTSYAMLVPEDQLPRANGMMQTIWSLSGLLSPAIAAAIIGIPAILRQNSILTFLNGLQDGTPLLMAIDAFTFLVAAGTLVFLFIPSPKRTDLDVQAGQPKKSLWADIGQGAMYIWNRRPMLWLLGTFAVANFLAGPMGVFYPLLVKFNLQPDWAARGFTIESAMAMLGTVASLGGVLGGVLISSWGGLRHRRVLGVLVPMIVEGLAMITMGQSRWLYLSAAMFFVLDSLIPIMNAHSQAIWQIQTPRELQGRVFSVRRVIAQFTWPLSTAVAGWLGGLFDPGAVVSVLGVILIVFIVAQLFNPYLLRVEDKDYLEALAASRTAAKMKN